MAARAGSVYLKSSMDQKPSRKGGARPCPKQHHPVPQGSPFSFSSADLATECPPEAHNQSIPIKTQLPQGQNTHKHFKAVLPHRPHKRSPHFLCGWGNNVIAIATTSASNLCQLPSNRMVPSITTAYSASLTDIASSLTSCHAPKAFAGFKGHHRIRDTPTYCRGQVLGPDVQALACEAMPNRKQQKLH